MANLTSQPITGDLLELDSLTIPEIMSYTVSNEKMYKDQQRNMNGAVRNTLVGTFPSIKVQFGYTNKTRMADIATKLQMNTLGVTYFDPMTNSTKTLTFYAGNFSPELLDKERGYFKPFDVTLSTIARI